jgi:hypothetical protein
MADLQSLTVPTLKQLAVDRGIKQAGVGWPTCCPLKGNKADIIRALARRVKTAPTNYYCAHKAL